ncbi:MAG: NERD domain-containing protein [Phycisphaeraceae bacterium]|nr:NERD domain-containing protein [Phycisphaeraceae bacterium]
MIIRPYTRASGSTNDRLALAGEKAEEQLAFYLHRAFSSHPDLFVVNGLRLVDPEQPEHDGSAGVCQIDHLIVHRFGVFIIESKSISEEVRVRGDGAGGDEWVRVYRGRETGFPSPIQQARRQGEFLRAFLQRHRGSLLGRVPMGLRTIAKIVHHTDQRGFKGLAVQVLVAVSDRGRITRLGGWTPPEKPFQVHVCKADLVPDRVTEEFKRHVAGSSPMQAGKELYGAWSMRQEEPRAVAEFLAARHQPLQSAPVAAAARVPDDRAGRSHASSAPLATEIRRAPQHATGRSDNAQKGQSPPRPAAPVTQPRCGACGDARLVGRWGKYGYYWKCEACGKNTPMPTICSICGAEGRGGKVVRIRKQGPVFLRRCEPCGLEERIWTDAER